MRHAARSLELLTLASLALFAGACSEEAAPAPEAARVTAPFVSGSRLRARTAVGPDGVRHLLGAFDKELGTLCTPLALADGRIVCAPPSVGVTFEDAACTQPVAVLLPDPSGAAAIGPYLSLPGKVTGKCGGIPAPEKIVKGVAGPVPPQHFASAPDGSCTLVGSPPAGVTALRPGEGPKLVALTTRTEVRGDLVAVYFDGDDGSSQQSAVQLPVDGGSAHIWKATDDVERWMPFGRVLYVEIERKTFSDAACSAPSGLTEPKQVCETPNAIVAFEEAGCFTRERVFALGPSATTPSHVLGGSGGTECTPIQNGDPADGKVSFALGAEVPASAFPAVRRVNRGVRISQRTITDSAEQLLQEPAEYFDESFRVSCVVERVGGAQAPLLCRPRGTLAVSQTGYFTDAACTVPVLQKRFGGDSGCRGLEPSDVVVIANDGSSSDVGRFYLLTGPFAGEKAYARFTEGGECELADYPTSLGLSHTGRVIADSELAVFTENTE